MKHHPHATLDKSIPNGGGAGGNVAKSSMATKVSEPVQVEDDRHQNTDGKGHVEHGNGHGYGHEGGNDNGHPDPHDRDDDHDEGYGNDKKPRVSVVDTVAVEGGFALVTIALSWATTHPVHVDYRSLDGTAVAGSDYESVKGRITIPAGATSAVVRIPLQGDTLDEAHESFGLTITKATGAVIADATGTITILDDDAPTVPGPLTATTHEDAVDFAMDLLSGIMDANGDAVRVEGLGSLTRADGTIVSYQVDGASFRFDPRQFNDLAEGQSETITLAYRVTDGSGSASRTLTITVVGANDAPTAASVSANVSEDGPSVAVGLFGDDPDQGAGLTYTMLSQPEAGVVSSHGDGTFSFDPAGAFEALREGETRSVSFAYQVTDEHGAKAQAIASILVVGVNDAPEAEDDFSVTLRDAPRTILAADLLANDHDVEGDPLAIVGVADGTGGTVTLDGSGNILFVPEPGFVGDATFRYTVADGQGGVATATVTVKVLTTFGNSEPIAVDDFLLGTCGDDVLVDGAGATTLVGGGGRDTLIGGAGDDTLLVVGGDDVVMGGDGQDAVVVVGDAPVTLDMGAASVETFIGGSGDDTVIVGAAGGTVVGGEGVDAVVLPGTAAEYAFSWVDRQLVITAPDGATTQVSGTELADFADLDVEFDADMRPCGFRVFEDRAVIIPKGLLLRNDSDPDGDPLSIVSIQQPVNSTVSLTASGDILFQGLADFNGLATFTYTISDGRGGFDTATVTVKVWPVNDLPEVTPPPLATDEDSPLAIAVSDLLAGATDVDGDTLAVSSVGNAIGGTVTMADGIVTFTPAPDFNGEASFEYIVADGHGGFTTTTAIIPVAAVNDAPVAADILVTVPEDGPGVSLALPGSDVDTGAVLEYQIVGMPGAGTFAATADGTVTFDPAGAFEHLHDGEVADVVVAYRVTDEHGASSEATATIRVLGVNDAPDGGADTLATVAGLARLIPVADLLSNDHDVEGDALSIVSVAGISGGSVELGSDGTIRFTPASGFVGEASFTYTLDDGHGGQSVIPVTVTVVPAPNNAPMAFDDFLLGTWGDDELVAAPGGSTLVGGSGTDTLIGGAGDDTLFTDGGDVISGGGGHDTVIVAGIGLTIDMAASGVETVVGGDAADTIISGSGSDVIFGGAGNDTIVLGQPGGADTVVGGEGEDRMVVPGAASDYAYVRVPGGGWAITAADGSSTTVTGVEFIDFGDLVVEFDQAMMPARFRILEDVAVTIPKALLLANDVDPDGDALTIVSVQDAVNASASLTASGDIRFQGAPDYNGLATFTYTVSDGRGGTATATVTVKVWPVNDAPVAVADSLPGVENQPVTIAAVDLLANDTDADGDILRVTAIGDAVGGTVALDGVTGTILFTPTPGYSGTVSFSYTVSDGNGGTAGQRVSFPVTITNHPPVAGDDTVLSYSGAPITIDPVRLLANDFDPEGKPLSITNVSNAVHGTVSIDASGRIVFTPEPGYTGGGAQFDYEVTDALGASDVATVRVSQPPTASLLVGPERKVVAPGAANPQVPSVAVLENGGTVLVWAAGSGTEYDVYGQVQDAAGTVWDLGRISTFVSGNKINPQVAAQPGGGFVVTWQSDGQDGSSWGIYGQRYDATGIELGGEFRLNGTVGGSQDNPQVTGLADGGFVAVWNVAGNLMLNRFNAAGASVTGEVRFNIENGNLPSVAALPDGGFVTAWWSKQGSDVSPFLPRLVVRRFAANGTSGPEILLPHDGTVRERPQIVALADGKFVVAWEAVGGDGIGYGINARLLSTAVQDLGQFPINTWTAGDQRELALVATADGGFVVTWQSYGQDGSGWGVYAQRFNAIAGKVGDEFLVAETIAGDQGRPAVAARPDGGFVISWHGNDGSGLGVYSREFVVSDLAPVVDATGTIVGAGRSVAAASLFVTAHAQGDEITPAGLHVYNRYAFEDVTAGGGHFEINGVLQSAPFEVASTDLSQVRWVAGTQPGSDTYRVRAFDGIRWSAWEEAEASTVAVSPSLAVGAEERVATPGAANPQVPSVAVLANGASVLVWTAGSGTEYDVYGEIRDSSGTVRDLGRINAYTANYQVNPQVVALSGGGVAVIWQSLNQDGSGWGVYGQRFDGAGIATGAEFRLNAGVGGNQDMPQLAALADGGFVAVYQSNGEVNFNRFNAAGISVSGEQRLHIVTGGTKALPTVSALPDGGFVTACWSNLGSDVRPFLPQLVVRKVGPDGTAGGEIILSQDGTARERPQIVALADGKFVVAWEAVGGDGVGYGMAARLLSAAGQDLGQFPINTWTAGDQREVALAATADGGFVATWQSHGQDGSGWGVYAQRFNASAGKVGGEFLVAETTAGDQGRSAVAARPDGGFVISWHGNDGSGFGVYSRVYAGTGDGSDVVFNTVGQDTLIGGGGADVFTAGRESGADVIDNRGHGADGDLLSFGTGVAVNQLWFERSGDSLKVKIIGTADSVTIQDWYDGEDNRVASITTSDGGTLLVGQVENLVSAMSAFQPPSAGQLSLSEPYYQDVAAVIAANWQTT